ncbi:MAG TPA: serine/threonine protein kinase, partial [Methylophilaceae bacterium]|nr:serine/threonine protein kinase [Methylophilaceae bacterium]
AADQRLKNDLLVPAERLGKDIYSRNLLMIIDRCMALDHMQRPQSVFSLQKALREDVPLDDKKSGIMEKLKDYLHK